MVVAPSTGGGGGPLHEKACKSVKSEAKRHILDVAYGSVKSQNTMLDTFTVLKHDTLAPLPGLFRG
jgi:hypothetical protein